MSNHTLNAPNLKSSDFNSEISSITTHDNYQQQRIKSFREGRESAKHSLQLLDNCEKQGTDALNELHKQREQITRISNKMDDIDNHINAAERLLRGISSIGGTIFNKLTVDNSYKPHQNPSLNTPNSYKQHQHILKVDPSKVNSSKQIKISDLFEDKETKDYFDETDAYLDQMGDKLELLKEMGINIGHEIKGQTDILDELQGKVEKDTQRLQKINTRMKTL